MAIELITGRAGEPHVDSADVGALNAALFGAGAYVLEGVVAELVDANSVLVTAGEMLCEGRHIRITGDGETLAIENGLSSYKRHDIVAAHYLRNEDGIESVMLEVVKGTNSSTSPQDPPMPRTGKVIDGASEAYWPLYRIVIDGLTPQTPVFIAQRQALYQLGLGTEIPAGADLNDFTTPGVYRCVSADIGSSLLNCPINNAFMLIVEASIGGSYILQTIKHYTMTAHGQPLELRRNREWNFDWIEWKPTAGIDSIVAEGQSGDYRWIKYANGTCDIRLRHTVNVSVTTADSGQYRTGSALTYALPFPVYECVPNFQILDKSNMWVGLSGVTDGETAISAFIRCLTSWANVNVGVGLRVTGRWK